MHILVIIENKIKHHNYISIIKGVVGNYDWLLHMCCTLKVLILIPKESSLFYFILFYQNCLTTKSLRKQARNFIKTRILEKILIIGSCS